MTQLVPEDQPVVTGPPPVAPASGVDALLELVRAQLGMDVAFISERVDDDRRFRNIASSIGLPIDAGFTEPYAGTYCQMITDGVIESVIRNSHEHPVTRHAPHTDSLGIGAYVGVPIARADGTPYGTVCVYSREPNGELSQRDADVLRAVADVLVELIAAEDAETAQRRATTAAIDGLERDDELVIDLEPVVDLETMTVVGAEALCRLPDGTGYHRWLAAARDVGLAVQLEHLVVRKVVEALGTCEGYVSVDLTTDALSDPGFAELVRGADLSRLVVEVTEHEHVPDYGHVLATTQPLRRDGMRIAIDDAGAGFASLRHVLMLEPDLIKLDSSLLDSIDTDEHRQTFVEALAGFATRMDAVPLAQGIDTAEKLQWARELGITLGQGPLLREPPAPTSSLPSGRPSD
ncbi:MAG: EAL domain-containing protein [Nocardioidaceae bacterium]|nr:EAL domain-containing protein [Nocardioidaceae bacterium]